MAPNQAVEALVTTNNSPSQQYIHTDDQHTTNTY